MFRIVLPCLIGLVVGLGIGGAIVAIDDQKALKEYEEYAEQVAKKAYNDGFLSGVQVYKELNKAQQ